MSPKNVPLSGCIALLKVNLHCSWHLKWQAVLRLPIYKIWLFILQNILKENSTLNVYMLIFKIFEKIFKIFKSYVL